MLQDELGFTSWLCWTPPGLLLVPHLSFPMKSSPRHHALLVMGWGKSSSPYWSQAPVHASSTSAVPSGNTTGKKGPQQAQCSIFQRGGSQKTATILLLHQRLQHPSPEHQTRHLPVTSAPRPISYHRAKGGRWGEERKKKKTKNMFSLLAAQWRQHLPLPTPDSAKLSFHHLIAHTMSPRRHTEINVHRSLSQEFINSFKGQGLIFHLL